VDKTENTAFFNVLDDKTQNTITFPKESIIINNAICRRKSYFRKKLRKLCVVCNYTYYMDIKVRKDRIYV
jgi:hypothetical protein